MCPLIEENKGIWSVPTHALYTWPSQRRPDSTLGAGALS